MEGTYVVISQDFKICINKVLQLCKVLEKLLRKTGQYRQWIYLILTYPYGVVKEYV
jgi:hypothetical protein